MEEFLVQEWDLFARWHWPYEPRVGGSTPFEVASIREITIAVPDL